MKLSRYLFQVICFIFIAGCTDQLSNPNKTNLQIKNGFSTLKNEPQLIPVIDQISKMNNEISNPRLSSRIEMIDYQILTDTILKTLQPDSINFSYAFRLSGHSNSRVFANLVLKKVSGGYLGFILEYSPNSVWFDDFTTFTGTISRFDLTGNLLSVNEVKNGVLISKLSNGGRTTSETTCLADVSIYEECEQIFAGWSQRTGESVYTTEDCYTVIEYTYESCPYSPSGGGENGGTFITDPWNSTGGGGGGTGSGTSGESGDSQINGEVVGVLPPTQEEIEVALLNSLYEVKVHPSLETNQKAKCIYEKLNATNVFREIIHAFEDNGSVLNLTFKVEELVAANRHGETRATAPFYNDVVVVLDSTNIEIRRTVEVARTFLHEAIHAKIYAEMNKAGLADASHANSENFPALFDAYVLFKNGEIPQDQINHQVMATKYIDLIAEGVREFDTRNNNNSEISIDHYKALAWEGLRETLVWRSLSDEQRQSIVKKKSEFLLDCGCTVINCN